RAPPPKPAGRRSGSAFSRSRLYESLFGRFVRLPILQHCRSSLSSHMSSLQRSLLLQLHRPDVSLPISDGEVEVIWTDGKRSTVELPLRIRQSDQSAFEISIGRNLPDRRSSIGLPHGNEQVAGVTAPHQVAKARDQLRHVLQLNAAKITAVG